MRAADLLGWIAAGELDVRIGARYPLEDAARAQADLASRATTGKLLLTPFYTRGWCCGSCSPSSSARS